MKTAAKVAACARGRPESSPGQRSCIEWSGVIDDNYAGDRKAHCG